MSKLATPALLRTKQLGSILWKIPGLMASPLDVQSESILQMTSFRIETPARRGRGGRLAVLAIGISAETAGFCPAALQILAKIRVRVPLL